MILVMKLFSVNFIKIKPNPHVHRRNFKAFAAFERLEPKGIAKKLGISQPAYSKLEKRKKVNPEQLKKIMDILKCSSDEINVVKKVQH